MLSVQVMRRITRITCLTKLDSKLIKVHRNHIFIKIYCFIQAKILYKDIPFHEDERENIKLKIQSNVYGYLGILLEGRERFEDESLAEMMQQQSSSGTDSAGGFIFHLFLSPH